MERKKYLFNNEEHLADVLEKLNKEFPQLRTSHSGSTLFVESKGFHNDKKVFDFVINCGGIPKPKM